MHTKVLSYKTNTVYTDQVQWKYEQTKIFWDLGADWEGRKNWVLLENILSITQGFHQSLLAFTWF